MLDATAAELMAQHGGSVMSYGVRHPRTRTPSTPWSRRIFADGPLTGLVNNAAGNFICRTQDLSPRGFDAVANIVMHGTFYVTHAVGRRWIARQAATAASVISIVVTWVGTAGPSWCRRR